MPISGRSIRVSGAYLQEASGASFPERIGDLVRTRATSWADDETNVGISYDHGREAHLTVYVYPAGDPYTGRLRAEFLDTARSLEQLNPAALREGGTIVLAASDDGASGFEVRFKLLDAEPERDTLAQVFQCGRWFLKIRATYSADYPIDSALGAVQGSVRCGDLARHDPIGTKRTIDYDAAGGPEWLVYGATQWKWIEAHVAPEDLAYGIPDHEPALFVEALEAMLDARQAIQADGTAGPNPFLERMLQVRSAGFLREYVLTEYLGFLAPPAETGSRLEEFARWRERALPELRAELHAGVRLAGD